VTRASRVPYHQNVYDLFQLAQVQVDDAQLAQIAEWENRTGRVFPAAMTEFYTRRAQFRVGGERQEWNLTLSELWSEYSNEEYALPVPEVFEPFTPRPHSRIPAAPTVGFQLIWENQGNWVMCARADGTVDPLVDVSGLCAISPRELWEHSGTGWHSIGRFTEVVMSWFAKYYLEDFTPISYGHRGWENGLELKHAPPKAYHNGLWLRTPNEPFQPPVIDFLIDRFGEPERTSRPGDVTTYTYRPPEGRIRVTADEPALAGGLSAWWVHADTPERLAEFAELLLPWGTLRDTLRADTDPARDVLKRVRSGGG
jgi:hypothetical protein